MTVLLDRPRPLRPDIRDNATRRELTLGGAAAGLLVVAGCGSEEQGDAAPPTIVPGDGSPVTIEHTSLGFELPEQTGEISREEVELLDPDVIVVIGDDRQVYEDDQLFQDPTRSRKPGWSTSAASRRSSPVPSGSTARSASPPPSTSSCRRSLRPLAGTRPWQLT